MATLCYASIVLLLGATADVGEVGAAHVRVALVSEQAALAAGSDASLGLQFTIAPGWHLYWRNPGDAGQAPEVRWTLPAGVTVDGLGWPPPQRMPVGPLMNYGYAGDVMLPAPLHLSPTLAGQAVTVAAEVHWLVCAETCVPGRARLTRTLPLGNAEVPEPTQAARFAATRRALPRAWPRAWRARVQLDGQAFTVSVEGMTGPPRGADLFAHVPRMVDHGARPAFAATPHGLRLRIPRSDQLVAAPATFAALLAVDGEGPGGGVGWYDLLAPVAAGPHLAATAGHAAPPSDGTATAGFAAQPSDGTATAGFAAQPSDGTATAGRATQPNDGTATAGRATQPNDGTATAGRATQPSDGTATAGRAAQPGDGAEQPGDGAAPLGEAAAPPGDGTASPSDIAALRNSRAVQPGGGAAAEPVAVAPAANDGAAAHGSSTVVGWTSTTMRGATTAPAAPSPRAAGLALALAAALLGGMLLNLMPCVFPVLSLKVLAMVELAGRDGATVRRHAWAYTAGVLASFWALGGAVAALRIAGSEVGWGFQLQSPRFVMALALLLAAMAANLFGAFEVGGTVMGVGQRLAARGGTSGAFFTGMLATVVATPCTAPFMGSAMGYALAQPAWVGLAVFTALALGLALPYLALAYAPRAARLLPRPGAWMVAFRQAMAFPLLGTAAWLLWVLGVQVGVDGMGRALGALLVVTALLWGYGAAAARPGFARAVLAAAGLAAGGAVGTVPVAAAPAAMGTVVGAAGPVTTGMDARADADAGAGVHAGTVADAAADAGVNTGTVAGPGNLAWKPWSAARVAAHRRAGRPVFVDFTAAWCVSCRVNEALVFGSAEVRAALAARRVALLRADWTRQDPAITAALAGFGRAGVPLYVLYAPATAAPPTVLPEALLPSQLLRALAAL